MNIARNNMNEKYFVFVISAGRTGTKFFGNKMGQMIPSSFSVHEPDSLTGLDDQIIKKIQQFGLYHLTLGKALGKTGIRNISQNYLAGKINLDELTYCISRHTKKCYSSLDNELITDSNYGWYGAIPGIQSLYDNYNIIHVVRSPQSWLNSNLSWGVMFGKRDWVNNLWPIPSKRLNPKMIHDIQYEKEWDSFSNFQKLCWTWKTINEIILKSIEKDTHAITVKFEDLFISDDKYVNLQEMLGHATDFPGKKFPFVIPENILEQKVHQSSSSSSPEKNEWSSEMKESLKNICGDLMQKLDYKIE